MKRQSKQWFLALGLFSVCMVSLAPALAAQDDLNLIGLAMHRETGRDIYLGALRARDQLGTPAEIVSASGERAMEFRIVARRTSIRSVLGGILLQAELASGTSPSSATVDFANAIMSSVQGSLYTGDSFTLLQAAGGDTVAMLDSLEMARTEAQGVFDYFLDSVHHVMGEFRMDGYRHDAVMAMTDSGWTAQWDSGQDLMRAMNRLIDRRYSDAHAIAEIYIDSDWVINGIEFDSQYHNSFKNAMRDAVFGASFGSPNIAGVAAALDGTGSVSGTDVFNYFELHDDAWPLNGHERAVRAIDTSFPHDDDFARGRTTLANTLTILSKGIPAILHGTEWLENDGWEENKIDWSHKTTYDGVFRMYQDVIALRTGEAALRANQPAWVFHTNNSADVLAFERWEIGGDSYVVVANFSNDDYGDYRVGLPRAGAWDVVLNTQHVDYDGSGYGTSGTIESEPVGSGPHGQSVSLQLPAMGVLVLRNSADIGCPADLNDDGELNFFDVSAFLVAYTGGDLSVDFDGSGTLNFFDISVFLLQFNTRYP